MRKLAALSLQLNKIKCKMKDFMFCEQCDCGCFILPLSCLYEKQGRLKKIHIEDYPEVFNAVNTFILIGDNEITEGLIGQKCFDELCSHIKEAEQQASDYRINTIDAQGEQTEFWFYLSDKWKQFLKNSHFQNLYSAWLMYYYYLFYISSSESSRDGEVKHNRAGVENSGEASTNITDPESKTRTAIALGIAKRYTSVFKDKFLEKRRNIYSCLPSKCKTCESWHCNSVDYCDSCNSTHNSNSVHNYGELPHDNKRKTPRKPRSTAL